jgi:D-3-phosphoglycerate dehydrogenase/(S)-sulfolactate dehydrogenase
MSDDQSTTSIEKSQHVSKQRVLITTAWLRPGDDVDKQLRASGFEVIHKSFVDRTTTGESLIDAIGDVDAVLAGTDAFTAEVLAAAATVKVIGRTGAGYDNIDVAAATELGIAVCPTPGVNSPSVAEYAMALILSCARRIPQSVANVRAHGWDQVGGSELAGATLGIVGLGAIGKLVANMALGFGMHVIAHDPRLDEAFVRERGIPSATLDDLLAASDFVTLHLFLDASTRHLINERTLALMKPTAFLVNTSRGGVIDERALADAIRRGALAGAGLDTVEEEPLPRHSELRAFDNVLITAHVGAATAESRVRSGRMAAQSVIDVLGGLIPPQTVNPEFAAKRSREHALDGSHE